MWRGPCPARSVERPASVQVMVQFRSTLWLKSGTFLSLLTIPKSGTCMINDLTVSACWVWRLLWMQRPGEGKDKCLPVPQPTRGNFWRFVKFEICYVHQWLNWLFFIFLIRENLMQMGRSLLNKQTALEYHGKGVQEQPQQPWYN